ncbi:hypothetical protein L1049_024616 [Liquidambar formosana]|uniref:Pentatricopeptide repeat-containing protein n=1 Tax=Liquidambar formosana TaxID=63359 RepID=A0AAP0RUT9_LIQFO
MIVGLGMNGFGEEALECLAHMEMEAVPMDDLIFLGVLTACSHAGLVTEGLRIFDQMKRAYRIEPKPEHYGCLVDLLGRAGRLEEAQNVIETMPMKPNPALWGSLLLACRTHQHVALAEVVVERLVELKADDCGVYALISNIYADVGMWEGMQRIRELMKVKKTKEGNWKECYRDGNVRRLGLGIVCLHSQSPYDHSKWNGFEMQIYPWDDALSDLCLPIFVLCSHKNAGDPKSHQLVVHGYVLERLHANFFFLTTKP